MLSIQVSTRALLLVLGGLVALWAVSHLWEIVVVVAAAFIFMAALLPYVDWMTRHHIHRVVAVLILLLAFLLALAGLTVLVVPPLIDETRQVRESLPEDAARADAQLARLGIDSNLEERVANIDWSRLISGRAAVSYGQRIVLAFISLITVVVLTAYLLVDAPRLSQFLFQFVRPGHEPDVQRFMASLRRVVGGYIRGQFITSVIIATYTTAVMTAVQLPNAVAFGVFAAVADIIPVVGSVLAVGPPVLVALQESPLKATIVLIALLAYQQFEDRFIAPRVYGATLNLPPLIILVAVLVGAELFGITGVLLALPAAAVARVLLDYYLERRALAVTMPGPTEDVLAPDAADGNQSQSEEERV